MNNAGLETNTPIQFCMMQPSDLLNTLRFDAVTNGRASDDYAAESNWDVGGASLLFWAVGLRPSKDNFWSGDGQRRQQGFSQTNPGTNGELNAIIATMSTGPVGPSDGAGQHNSTRLMRTCAADGTILQPSRPMTPIDASFFEVLAPTERQLHAAAVWSTFSKAADTVDAGAIQYHILGVDVKPPDGMYVPIKASDLYPVPPPGMHFAVRDWHRSEPCIDGTDAVASRCMQVVDSVSDDGARAVVNLDEGVRWPFGTHMMQLHTVTVLSFDKVTLLGELNKYVPISNRRFRGLKTSATTLTAILIGGVGEVVHVTALRPNSTCLSKSGSWIVVTADVTIGLNGTGLLHLDTSADRLLG